MIDSIHRLGSDHFPIYCNLDMSINKKYFKNITYRDLSSLDRNIFDHGLNGIVQNFKISGSFSNSVTELAESFYTLLDEHAPIKSSNISVVDRAPWFDQEYRDLRKLRRNAERKKFRSANDYLLYKNLCMQANELSFKKKKEYLEKKVNNSAQKSRTLYKIVNRVLDRKQTIVLPDYTEDINVLANDFNNYFIDKIIKIRDNIPITTDPQMAAAAPGFLLSEFQPTNDAEIESIIKETGINCPQSDILPQSLYKENISSLIPV